MNLDHPQIYVYRSCQVADLGLTAH